MPAAERVSIDQIAAMHVSAKDLLISDLKALRKECGDPSLGDLAKLSRGKFSKSTLDDHLAGRRTTIPNWRITAAYIQACYGFAKSTGLAIDRLGSLDEWRVRWQAARDGDAAAASPIRDNRNVSTYAMTEEEQEYTYEVGPSPTGSRSGAVTETTASITAITRRLKVDIANLRSSLPPGQGVFIVTSGPEVGRLFQVIDELTIIGRSSESDIILDDPTVSRRHAVIHRSGRDFTVRDVGSRNGTFLHQRQLSTEVPLPSDEELQIGVFRMLFVKGGQTELPAALRKQTAKFLPGGS